MRKWGIGGVAQVSEFQPADQDEVRCLILAGLREHWGRIDDSLNSDLIDIDASYGTGRTVVVRLQGSIVATGTTILRDPTTAEIVRMSVAAGQRRRGLGRLVIHELVTTARSWGASAVVLETSAGWREAVGFYRSCGFTVTHEETGLSGPVTWFRLEL